MRDQPAFEVVTEEGLLKLVNGSLQEGGIYVGGHAQLVEEAFGLQGSRIMYIGDHVESDVHVSKSILRWRTGLVLRELEDELACLCESHDRQAQLTFMMGKKATLFHSFCKKCFQQKVNSKIYPQLVISSLLNLLLRRSMY